MADGSTEQRFDYPNQAVGLEPKFQNSELSRNALGKYLSTKIAENVSGILKENVERWTSDESKAILKLFFANPTV